LISGIVGLLLALSQSPTQPATTDDSLVGLWATEN